MVGLEKSQTSRLFQNSLSHRVCEVRLKFILYEG